MSAAVDTQSGNIIKYFFRVTYTVGRLVAYLQIDKSITEYGKHKAVNIIYEKTAEKKELFCFE